MFESLIKSNNEMKITPEIIDKHGIRPESEYKKIISD